MARKPIKPKDRTIWRPSDAQERLLYVFWDNCYQITISRACTEARIGRQTYYDWTHDPRFNRWWIEQLDRFFVMMLPQVHAAMFKAATEDGVPGTTHARRLYLQRFDANYVPYRRKRQAPAETFSFEQAIASLEGAG